MQVTSARRRQRLAFVQPTAVLRYLADLAATTAANGNGGLPEGVTPETLDLTRTGEPAPPCRTTTSAARSERWTSAAPAFSTWPPG